MRYHTTVKNKEDGSEITFDYVWVDSKLISTVYTENNKTKTAKYIYNDFDEPVGMLLTDEETGVRRTYYYLKNAQGDITNIVSSSGSKMVEFTYDAWGKRTIHYQADVTNPNNIIRWFEQVTACALTPFGYRGYCYDMYTDLYYLQSRYYDPNTGRFINSDDTNYLNATGTVLGCNLFAYCENDGVNNVDPKGNISVGASMVIGALLGVLGLYMMDVLFNLIEGRIKWYKRTSSTIDYISAGVSGALSMLSIKKISAVLSAGVDGVTYILKQWRAGKKISFSSLLITIGISIVLDIAFPGDGIDLSNRVGVIKTSKLKLKKLVSKAKIKVYINKIKKNIAAIIKNAFYTLVVNIISYVADRMNIIKYTKNLAGYLRRVLIV